MGSELYHRYLYGFTIAISGSDKIVKGLSLNKNLTREFHRTLEYYMGEAGRVAFRKLEAKDIWAWSDKPSFDCGQCHLLHHRVWHIHPQESATFQDFWMEDVPVHEYISGSNVSTDNQMTVIKNDAWRLWAWNRNRLQPRRDILTWGVWAGL